jgi:hypothetical protein
LNGAHGRVGEVVLIYYLLSQDGAPGQDGRDGYYGSTGSRGGDGHDGLPGYHGEEGKDGDHAKNIIVVLKGNCRALDITGSFVGVLDLGDRDGVLLLDGKITQGF